EEAPRLVDVFVFPGLPVLVNEGDQRVFAQVFGQPLRDLDPRRVHGEVEGPQHVAKCEPILRIQPRPMDVALAHVKTPKRLTPKFSGQRSGSAAMLRLTISPAHQAADWNSPGISSSHGSMRLRSISSNQRSLSDSGSWAPHHGQNRMR